jgi:hypothetical protein
MGELRSLRVHGRARVRTRWMEAANLLDVIVANRLAVVQLLSTKYEPLLLGRNALLVLNFGFDVGDRVALLNIHRDGLAGERLDEDLAAVASPQAQAI